MADIKVVIEALDHCIRAKDCRKCKYLNRCKYLDVDSLELLKSQQAEIDRLKAEQQKVIWCKDCKYGVKHELDLSNMYECGYPFTIVQEGHFGDFFCSMAEPKAGEPK